MRQNLPKKWFATRIENKHGGGVPDVHIVADGIPFWIELKVSKGNAVNLSAHQVAWNMAYFARGGANFILVKHLPSKHLFLFGGEQGPRLVESGVLGTEGLRFKDIGSLYDALRPHAAAILGVPCCPTRRPPPASEASTTKPVPTKEAQSS